MNLHHALLMLAGSASPAYSTTIRRRHLQADPTSSPTVQSKTSKPTPSLETLSPTDTPPLPVLVKSKSFPLEKCQLDCDEDAECGPDLICFQRSKSEMVPGCSGEDNTDFDKKDVCVTKEGVLHNIGNNINPGTGYYQRCEGDCDDDSDCAGDLKCFKRDDGEDVPGCLGNTAKHATTYTDYCYDVASIVPSTGAPEGCFGVDGTDLRTAAAEYMDQNCATTPDCAVENTWGPIEAWCTAYVTDMSDVFNGIPFNGNDDSLFLDFDADISGWNVSSAQTFFRMFRKAENFQADLSSWDVSNADNLEQMFRNAELFNADVSSWDLSSATSFSGMFRGAKAFDQDLTPWAAYFAPGEGNFKDMFRGSGIGQNLCSWNSTFPYGVNVDSMFLGADNCQNQTSPVQEVGGPFCANPGE